jgi:tripartite-type tricarboxylate transporter receptor subunit TctC
MCEVSRRLKFSDRFKKGKAFRTEVPSAREGAEAGIRETFMRTLLAAIAIAATLAGVAGAAAQPYPSRPITIIVPFPAGGPTDALARILAERMKRALGQTVVVENPTGAGGTIGTGRVARAAPDGYTLILGHWQTHVINGATYTLPFDVVKDFEPISLVADCPVWLIGKAALPPNNLADLIAWMKANPGAATVGIGGVGGGADVLGTYFQKNTGTRVQFVPYRGAAPMIQDLVAGQIDLTFTQVASSVVQVRAGQLKAYMVMAKTRWQATPDTPTIDEAGLPGLYASFWHGLWAPRGTPKDIVATLNAALVETLADPVVRQRFAEVGQKIWPRDQQTPQALAAQQQAEIEKWWPIIKAANIRAE